MEDRQVFATCHCIFGECQVSIGQCRMLGMQEIARMLKELNIAIFNIAGI